MSKGTMQEYGGAVAFVTPFAASIVQSTTGLIAA